MIFKEEAILLMILLETFTQDDWLSIAEESDAYGYAIIKPTAVWKPKRERFEEDNTETSQEQSGLSTDEDTGNTRIVHLLENFFKSVRRLCHTHASGNNRQAYPPWKIRILKSISSPKRILENPPNALYTSARTPY